MAGTAPSLGHLLPDPISALITLAGVSGRITGLYSLDFRAKCEQFISVYVLATAIATYLSLGLTDLG